MIAHEVGHAIGLPHNMIASSAYPVDSLRSPTFTQRMGIAPTIMDYARQNLEELYGELVSQWNRYIGHALNVVGGVHETRKATDQDGPVYEAVARQRQRQAVRFLVDQIFQTPTWLSDPEILRRIEHAGAVDRIRQLQVARLSQLLEPGRMQRLIESQIFDPQGAYGLLPFLDDVKAGVWSELDRAAPIDVYRRNLQRGYLERMEYLMTQEPTTSGFFAQTRVDVSQSDIRPFVRGQLGELRAAAERAANRTRDRATRYHLQDVVARIDEILPGDKKP